LNITKGGTLANLLGETVTKVTNLALDLTNYFKIPPIRTLSYLGQDLPPLPPPISPISIEYILYSFPVKNNNNNNNNWLIKHLLLIKTNATN